MSATNKMTGTTAMPITPPRLILELDDACIDKIEVALAVDAPNVVDPGDALFAELEVVKSEIVDVECTEL